MMMKFLMLILLLFPTIIYSQNILKAVKYGDVYAVEAAIENGTNVDYRNSEDDDTPLILASRNGNIEIVKLLLDAGADVTLTGFFASTAMRSASDNENWEIVALLEQAKAKHDPPLIKAIKSNNINDVNIMINENTDVNITDIDGKSALMWASSVGNIEAVRLLVGAGANIDYRNSLYVNRDDPNANYIEGHSVYYFMEEFHECGESSYIKTCNSLMWAVENNHFEVVEFLVGIGADVNMETDFESTALTLAAKNGNVNIISLLLEKQIHIEKDDVLGNTALIYAAENGHAEAVRLLLDNKANIHAKASYRGMMPLMLASENGHVDVVKVLIEKGANLGYTNDNGVTPLAAATKNIHGEIVDLLTAAGATK